MFFFFVQRYITIAYCNACPHTENRPQKRWKNCFAIIEFPPYSPDLVVSDFHIFRGYTYVLYTMA